MAGSYLEDEHGYYAVDLRTGRESWLGLKSMHWMMALDPFGEWLIGFGRVDDGYARRIVRWKQSTDRLATMELNVAPPEDWPWFVLAMSSDLVLSYEGLFQNGAWTWRRFAMRRATDWSLQKSFESPPRVHGKHCLTRDHSTLVMTSGPSSLSLWDPISGSTIIKSIRGGRKELTGISFHPSGRFLAATSNDTTVKLYDTTTWQLARTYSWNIGRLRSIAFSPDGLLAAAGSDTGRIVVWDVEE